MQIGILPFFRILKMHKFFSKNVENTQFNMLHLDRKEQS